MIHLAEVPGVDTTDVVIIGAGVIGLSVAYHLALKDPKLKIIVLEKELMVGSGATAQCTGGIRHQFSTEVNATMTKLSLPFFRRFEEEMEYPICFEQNGYLMLTRGEGRMREFERQAGMQQSLGIPTRICSPEEVGDIFNVVDTIGLKGASFCPEDGCADPHGVTQGYWLQARRRGVRVHTGREVTGLGVEWGKVKSVRTGEGEISTGVVINCAGSLAAPVAAMAGYELPVYPFRRQVFVCEPVPEIGRGVPLTVDMDSGWYLHRESNAMLIGGTDRDTAPGYSQVVDWTGLEQVIDAALRCMPILEKARITGAYVGIRSLTPDYHAILGEAPAVEGLYLANGFSGHGFMHSPAVGLLLAEMVLDGRVSSLDISPLSPDRFAKGEKTTEANMF